MPTKRRSIERPRMSTITPRAVELYREALALQATGLHEIWEPEGRKREYSNISVALHHELGLRPWHGHVLSDDMNHEPLLAGTDDERSRFYDPSRRLFAELKKAAAELK